VGEGGVGASVATDLADRTPSRFSGEAVTILLSAVIFVFY